MISKETIKKVEAVIKDEGDGKEEKEELRDTLEPGTPEAVASVFVDLFYDKDDFLKWIEDEGIGEADAAALKTAAETADFT